MEIVVTVSSEDVNDGVGDDNSLSVDEEDDSSLALTTQTSASLSRFREVLAQKSVILDFFVYDNDFHASLFLLTFFATSSFPGMSFFIFCQISPPTIWTVFSFSHLSGYAFFYSKKVL